MGIIPSPAVVGTRQHLGDFRGRFVAGSDSYDSLSRSDFWRGHRRVFALALAFTSAYLALLFRGDGRSGHSDFTPARAQPTRVRRVLENGLCFDERTDGICVGLF